MMALATVGLFGSKIDLGTGKCGLGGFIASFHERAKQNASNVEQLAEFTESLAEDVFKLRSEINNNFFTISTELAVLSNPFKRKCLKSKMLTRKLSKNILKSSSTTIMSYLTVTSADFIGSRKT